MSEMPKAYEFKSTEERIYAWWEENGWFKPEIQPADVEPFVISIPPVCSNIPPAIVAASFATIVQFATFV